MDRSQTSRFARSAGVVLLVAGGALLSVGAYLLVDRLETTRARGAFERLATERIDALQRQISRNLEVVHALVGLFDASQQVEREEFTAFVSRILEREKSIQALEWVPRVPLSQRPTVESDLSRWSKGTRSITELMPQGGQQPALPRSEYYPVFYVEPYQGNEEALGFDLASNTERRQALEEARDSADLTASAALRLVQGQEAGSGVLILAPVYEGGAPVALADRRQRLKGYVAGVFRIAQWVASAQGKSPPAASLAMHLYLFDDRETPGNNLLHSWRYPALGVEPVLLTGRQIATGLHLQHTFMVAGRPWTLAATPATAFYGGQAPWEPWAALLAGLTLTGLVAAYLQALLTRTQQVERLVEERTALAEARAEAIEAGDRRLKAIIDGSIDGLITIDEAGRVQSFNPAAERIFGYTSAEIVGHNIKRLMPEPYQSEHDGYLRRYLETGIGKVVGERREVQGRRSDGSVFPMELAVTELWVGSRRFYSGVVADITQHKRLKRELEQFFTLSLEMLCIAGFDGYFKRLNPAWEGVLGFTTQELLAEPFIRFVHPEDRETTKAETQRLAQNDQSTVSFENRCRHKDGTYRVLVWNAVSSAEDGQIYAAARDITEQRRQIERIELQSSALKAAANAIVITDREGAITWVNPAFTQLTGYVTDEVTGKNPRILKSQAQDERFYSHLWRTILDGDVWQGELINRRKDGSEYTEGQTITPVFGEQGEITHFVSIKEDITLRKEAERQMVKAQRALKEANARLKELDRLKSLFIASMSHELRTPLNSIIGFTGVILQGLSGELSTTQADQLQRVYNAAKHLLALISDVIDISKIEAEKIDAYPEDFDLVQVIREAVVTLEQQARAKQLDLHLDLPDTLSAHSDRRRVLQCVLNLVSNAVKYTKEGSVTVSAAIDGDDLAVAVTDTGIGISKSDLKALFKPFIRLDSELRITVPGTGLGLYLTRKIATELLAGDIRATSRPGAGSTFVLRFKRELTTPLATPKSEEVICENGADH